MNSAALQSFVRRVRVDLSYLSGGYFIYFAQNLLYLVVDISTLFVLNQSKIVDNPTHIFERFSLIFTFTGVIASITQEFKGDFFEPLQLMLGGWYQKYLTRGITAWLVTELLFGSTLALFSLAGSSSIMHVHVTVSSFIGYSLALLLISTLGAFVAGVLRGTFLASLLPAALIISEVTVGGFTRSHPSPWTLTGAFLPLLDSSSWSSFILSGAISILVVGGLCYIIFNYRDYLYLDSTRSYSFRKRGTKDEREQFSWRIARYIESKNHALGIRFAQLFTNIQFLRLPIMFLWLGVYPLITNKILKVHGLPSLVLPIVVATSMQSMLMVSLIAPPIIEAKESVENEVLLFKSRGEFQRSTKRLWQWIFVVWSEIVILIVIAFEKFKYGEGSLTSSLRAIAVVAFITPMVVAIAFMIMRLPIDPRFYPVVAIVYYIINVGILGTVSGASRYAPTELISNLAGGRGLYQIIFNESAVSVPWIIGVLVLLYLATIFVGRITQGSKEASVRT